MAAAIRIAFFGDSLTLGVGDEEGLGWPGRLVRRAPAGGVDSYHRGAAGYERLARIVEGHPGWQALLSQ